MKAPDTIPIPWRERLGDWLRGPLPLLVWLAAGAGAVLLLRDRPGPGVLRGTVEEPSYPLAFGVSGQIDQWLRAPGTDVTAGQPIALLLQDDLTVSDTSVQRRLEVLNAEVGAVRARIERRRAETAVSNQADELARQAGVLEVQRDALTDARRFELDAAELRIDALGEEVDLEVARLERGRVLARLERGKALAEMNLFEQATVDDLELELAQVEAEVEKRVLQTSAVNGALEQALARLTEIQGARPAMTESLALPSAEEADRALTRELEAEVALVRARLDLERVELSRLQLARADRLLTAPVDGVLGDHLVLRGQFADAGAVVAYLRVPGERSLRLWLPAEAADQTPEPGQPVVIARTDPRAPRTKGRFLGAEPAVTVLPAVLQPDPARPRYGRALLVDLPAELDLLPGEVVLGWIE